MKLDSSRGVDFYWFSGTGNTLSVVRRMKGKFEQNGFAVTLKAIEREDPAAVDCGKIIGVGVTVAEQGTYPVVWDFIKSLPECPETPVFLVDTLMAYSGGIVGPVGRILKKKGYRLLGAKEIKMPSNFLVRKKDPAGVSEKISKGLNAVDTFASDLMKGTAVWRDIPFYSDFMSLFSRVNFSWRLFRKVIPLRVDHDVCTRCRLCESLCPVDNWSLDSNKNIMKWGDECMFCLRCFSYCPVNAISYGSRKNLQYQPLKAADFL